MANIFFSSRYTLSSKKTHEFVISISVQFPYLHITCRRTLWSAVKSLNSSEDCVSIHSEPLSILAKESNSHLLISLLSETFFMASTSWLSRLRSTSRTILSNFRSGSHIRNKCRDAHNHLPAPVESHCKYTNASFFSWSSALLPVAIAASAVSIALQREAEPSLCDGSGYELLVPLLVELKIHHLSNHWLFSYDLDIGLGGKTAPSLWWKALTRKFRRSLLMDWGISVV